LSFVKRSFVESDVGDVFRAAEERRHGLRVEEITKAF